MAATSLSSHDSTVHSFSCHMGLLAFLLPHQVCVYLKDISLAVPSALEGPTLRCALLKCPLFCEVIRDLQT